MAGVVITRADIVWAVIILTYSFGELIAAVLDDHRKQRMGAA